MPPHSALPGVLTSSFSSLPQPFLVLAFILCLLYTKFQVLGMQRQQQDQDQSTACEFDLEFVCVGAACEKSSIGEGLTQEEAMS